jgi:hypothetical protein
MSKRTVNKVRKIEPREGEKISKFVRRKDGTWTSTCHRWKVARSSLQRYDLFDRSKSESEEDQLVGMGLPTVAACEEMAKGFEWADRVEADPTGKASQTD